MPDRLKLDGGFDIVKTDNIDYDWRKGDGWDGYDRYIRVWQVIFTCEMGDQWVSMGAWNSYEDALEFGDRVKGYGSINPEKWFPIRKDDLPDYVVNWHLPEYN